MDENKKSGVLYLLLGTGNAIKWNKSQKLAQRLISHVLANSSVVEGDAQAKELAKLIREIINSVGDDFTIS